MPKQSLHTLHADEGYCVSKANGKTNNYEWKWSGRQYECIKSVFITCLRVQLLNRIWIENRKRTVCKLKSNWFQNVIFTKWFDGHWPSKITIHVQNGSYLMSGSAKRHLDISIYAVPSCESPKTRKKNQ